MTGWGDADARRVLQDGQSTNLIATLVAETVTISGPDYGSEQVVLTGAEPIVTYQVTTDEPHGGEEQ